MDPWNQIYTETGNDEVEEMLRQAEDAALLKLSVNGHTISSDLPPDLADRFQSLKSGPSTSKSSQKSTKSPIVRAEVGEDQSSAPIGDDPDDLLARFAALKASLPKPSSSSFIVESVENESSDLSESHEDEVDKIIRWAVDAARLDPSPESDDDDHDAYASGSTSDIDTSEDDEDDDYQKKKKKGNSHK